ncbi:MAG: NADP-specific glutamate dehydrogenase [Phycisphaerales bacterium]|nr:MAG: NADP-specific glutamate dehydrogenase [Phycisphaerales bacterium]
MSQIATRTSEGEKITSDLLDAVEERNPHEPEFIQAVRGVLRSIHPVLAKREDLREHRIFERLVEPERVIQFRVPWQDDSGELHINRGWRVQFSSALGPYKGGLRFHPSVNLSVLKFLGFEQIFKNALTMLPLGGGKGGCDLDPKGLSDHEIMRFCQSLMSELYRHIGADTDVPAGDINVGAREIGYLFGQYKRLSNRFDGVITGKGDGWGGSKLRPEATGYGLIYFAATMLEDHGDTLKGKRCLVSGAGNVSQYAVKKLIEMDAKVIAMSDSSGYIVAEDGLTIDQVEAIMHVKNEQRDSLESFATDEGDVEFHQREKGSDGTSGFWSIEADCVFPCATQNEVGKSEAKAMLDSGVKLIAEGANMPLNAEAMELVRESEMIVGPAKAANAGGVAVSGLEMSQNSQRQHWSREDVDERLKSIMRTIHDRCTEAAEAYEVKDTYVDGANIAGFLRVAEAMKSQGLV